MDLSTIEGLTEDQRAAITALHDSSNEGLRNKNAELLSEKKAIQLTAQEQQQIAELEAFSMFLDEKLNLEILN